ncbi:MAG: glycerophosphodiester phosphodiesterase [Flavobacterium sp.]|nr:glycerophosphodiester phosphodiesterase [Aeromicrobium sp.]
MTTENVGIENSLAAFAHAYRLGYRYFETDVRCSADGVVYAVHDKALDRLTGSPDLVGSMGAEQLDLQRLDQREPLTRLGAIYDAFPEARLNIDVKSDETLEATCAVVEAHDAVQRTCLASFSHRRLRRLRRRLPGVATSASMVEVIVFMMLPTFALKMLRRSQPVCLQVPPRSRGVRVVTRRFIDRAHALGLQVHVWTIDDALQINRLLDLGVDGIITDRTDVLKDVLIARGIWRDHA